jgi:hypothetical protein
MVFEQFYSTEILRTFPDKMKNEKSGLVVTLLPAEIQLWLE